MVVASEETIYTQETFRTLLDCMAHPGTVAQIEPALLAVPTMTSPYVMGIALMLLDQEVSFCMDGIEDEEAVRQIRIYTMARNKNKSMCDYLFTEGSQLESLEGMKTGTLQFPDLGATVICKVNRLSNESMLSEKRRSIIRFQLTGPGIKQETILYVDELNSSAVAQWKEHNSEFPLGIDWIFVDESGHVCCVPRSSEWTWEVI